MKCPSCKSDNTHLIIKDGERYYVCRDCGEKVDAGEKGEKGGH